MKLFLMDGANPYSSNVSKPLKILLADDSANIHRAVALALRKEPYELIYCDNGQDALRIVQEQHPALVLADLDMPGPTGREICQKIKTTPGLSNIKVILLCGSFDQVEDQKLEALAADGRLWKPFESHVLLSLLSTVLRAPTIRPAERTLVQVSAQKSQVQESSDPLRELTSEMIRQTFPAESDAPTLAQNLNAPPREPWEPTPVLEPTMPRKIETTQSLPRDISPFEQTLSPESSSSIAFESEASSTQDNLWSPSKLEGIPEHPGYSSSKGNPAHSDLGFYREKGPDEVTGSAESMPPPWSAPTLAEEPTTNPRIAKALTQAPLSKPAMPKNPTAIGKSAETESVRAIIREEIQKAFDGWFKVRLEEKLRSIIAEIEKE